MSNPISADGYFASPRGKPYFFLLSPKGCKITLNHSPQRRATDRMLFHCLVANLTPVFNRKQQWYEARQRYTFESGKGDAYVIYGFATWVLGESGFSGALGPLLW